MVTLVLPKVTKGMVIRRTRQILSFYRVIVDTEMIQFPFVLNSFE